MKASHLVLLPIVMLLSLARPAIAQETTTIEDLRAKPELGNAILAEIDAGNYGFLVHNRGFLFGLHDKEGKVLVSIIGRFILKMDAGGEQKHVTWSMDERTTAEVEESTRDGVKLVTVTVKHPFLHIKQEILCLKEGPRISFEFTKPEGVSDKYTVAEVKITPNAVNFDTSLMQPGQNPFVFTSKDGEDTLKIGLDPNWRAYNPDGNNVIPRMGDINLFPFPQGRSENVTRTLNLEITVP